MSMPSRRPTPDALHLRHWLTVAVQVLDRPPAGWAVPGQSITSLADHLVQWSQAAQQQDEANDEVTRHGDQRDAWTEAWKATEQGWHTEEYTQVEHEAAHVKEAIQRLTISLNDWKLRRRLDWNEPLFSARSAQLQIRDERGGLVRWWDKVRGFEVHHQARLAHDLGQQEWQQELSAQVTLHEDLEARLAQLLRAWRETQQPVREQLRADDAVWQARDKILRREAALSDAAVARAERVVYTTVQTLSADAVFMAAVHDAWDHPVPTARPPRQGRRDWQSSLPEALQPQAHKIADLEWSRLHLMVLAPALTRCDEIRRPLPASDIDEPAIPAQPSL